MLNLLEMLKPLLRHFVPYHNNLRNFMLQGLLLFKLNIFYLYGCLLACITGIQRRMLNLLELEVVAGTILVLRIDPDPLNLYAIFSVLGLSHFKE